MDRARCWLSAGVREGSTGRFWRGRLVRLVPSPGGNRRRAQVWGGASLVWGSVGWRPGAVGGGEGEQDPHKKHLETLQHLKRTRS